MVKMPILLAGHTMNPAAVIRPLAMGQQWRADSLSTASMELDDESPEVAIGDWIKLYAPNGMSGVFYVKGIKQDKVTKRRSVNLEHTMGLLADMVVFGEKTARDMGGTGSTVPVGTAITYLLNQQTETLWTLYQNDFPSVAQGWKFTNSQILADLNDLAEAIQDCQWEYDQSVFPWRLSLKAWPVSATMEMRMNRNISSMKVNIDRSHMYTRCYPTGKNNKHIDSVNGGVSYLDRNTATWGVVAQVITDNTIAEPALLKAWAEKQLKKNAEPAVTVSISGFDLSEATGEPMDKIVPGRVCRVPLPDYATTITERVTELNWKDCIRDEESVTVTLANEHKTIAGVLNEKAGGGGGGKKSNTEHDCELGENEVKIEEFDNADIWVNRDSVWAVCASYTVTTDAQGRHLKIKDGTALEIERDGAILGVYDTGNLTAGIIVNKINGGTVKINAAHIELNGETIASLLAAYSIECQSLDAGEGSIAGGSIFGNTLSAETQIYTEGEVTCGTLIVGEEEVKLADASVSGNTLTITKTDGSTINFNKAGTPTLSGSWSGGVLTVTSTPTPLNNLYYYLGHGTTDWSGRTGTIHITSAPSSGVQGTEVYSFTVNAPFTKVNHPNTGAATFNMYAYYSGEYVNMGSHNWYYHN